MIRLIGDISRSGLNNYVDAILDLMLDPELNRLMEAYLAPTDEEESQFVQCYDARQRFENDYGFDPMFLAPQALLFLNEMHQTINSLLLMDPDSEAYNLLYNDDFQRDVRQIITRICSYFDPADGEAHAPHLPPMFCRPHYVDRDVLDRARSDFNQVMADSIAAASSEDDLCGFVWTAIIGFTGGVIIAVGLALVTSSPGKAVTLTILKIIGEQATSAVIDTATELLTEGGVRRLVQELCGANRKIDEILAEVQKSQVYKDAIREGICKMIEEAADKLIAKLNSRYKDCSENIPLIITSLHQWGLNYGCAHRINILRDTYLARCPQIVDEMDSGRREAPTQ